MKEHSMSFIGFLNKESIDAFSKVKYPLMRGYLTYLRKGVSKNTINNRISCLRSLYKYLVKEELVENNPMALIENVKISKRIQIFYFQRK